MTTLKDLRKAAHVTVDSTGKQVVQIPLDVWERFLAEDLLAKEKTIPSREQIHKALLDAKRQALQKRKEDEQSGAGSR